MRVLVTVQPADGHLNPLLGLTAALRAAGHDVHMATSPAFVERIEARGERAHGVGRHWLESGPIEEPLTPEDEAAGVGAQFHRMFLRGQALAAAVDLLDLVDDLRPDLVVREDAEFAGALVAERRGIPWATFALSFPFSKAELFHLPLVDGQDDFDLLRARFDLPPATGSWFDGQLHICTLPAAYASTAPVGVPQVHVRPNVLDVVDDAVVPPWVDELDAAVYVSFGTVFAGSFPDVVSAAAHGAADAGAPTVVTTGPSVARGDLMLPAAPHVRIEDYVPQGPVLEGCGAVVCHGGTGTVLGALARGVPVVAVPLGADQFAHGAAIAANGAGIVLDAMTVTPAAVTTSVRAVLDEPSYAAGARRLQSAFASLPGPEVAVTHLEALVGA